MVSDAEQKAQNAKRQQKYYSAHRDQVRAWRRAHRDQENAGARVWYAAHRNQEIAKSRKWQIAHPDKIRALAAKWRRAHPDKVRAATRRWKQAHPEYVRASHQRRRAHKAGAPDTLTASEWRAICAAYKQCCAYCGKKRKLAMDHVLPLSSGGGTVASNIVPACKSCNSTKHDGPPLKPVKLALGI